MQALGANGTRALATPGWRVGRGLGYHVQSHHDVENAGLDDHAARDARPLAGPQESAADLLPSRP